MNMYKSRSRRRNGAPKKKRKTTWVFPKWLIPFIVKLPELIDAIGKISDQLSEMF